MTSTMQIVLGSLLLLICSSLHLGILVAAVGVMRRVGTRFPKPHRGNQWGIIIAIAFCHVVLAHTVQVWLWAATFVILGALTGISDALYFALVTYTTLGYGDVTVGEGFRLFAAMAAVTGLLNFGLSTAFLVGLLARLLPADIRSD